MNKKRFRINHCCKHFALSVMLLSASMVYSQTGIIKGKVADSNGKPLSGVCVQVKGKQQSVLTNEKGEFSISGVLNEELTFFHPHYYYSTARYNGKEKFTIQLDDRYFAFDGTKLPTNDSILVTAAKRQVNILHGEQSIEDIVQSYSEVTGKQLNVSPSTVLMEGLAGRVAGLNVMTQGGDPNGDVKYNVRGRGQRVLIDGIERMYTSIDPEQIESITVLKDALSTVMLGQRSSDGVIMITTKKGQSGAPRLSFTAQTAISTPLKLPNVLDAASYAELYNEAERNDLGQNLSGYTPKYDALDIEAYRNGTNPYTHPNVDWYDQILNPISTRSRINFNAQGTAKTVRYFVDLDYLADNGLFKRDTERKYNSNTKMERYIARANAGVDLTSSTFLQVNLMGRFQKNNQGGASPSTLFTALASTPNNAYPVYTRKGEYAGNSNIKENNLLAQTVASGYSFTSYRAMSIDVSLKQKLDILTPGLWVNVLGSYNSLGSYTTDRTKSLMAFDYQTGVQYGSITNQKEEGDAKDSYHVVYLKAAVGYDRSFGQHNLNALALASSQSTSRIYFQRRNVYDGRLPERYAEYVGRVSYNYDQRYYAEIAGGYSGYNWVAKDQRYMPVYAFGLAYNMANESFISNNLSWLSQLKLRATYGRTAQINDQTGYFSYIQKYIANQNDMYSWGQNGSREQGGKEDGIANPFIHAEKADKFNLGLDLGFWDNTLTITAEYFKNKYFDLIGTRGGSSGLLGGSFPKENLNKTNYYGFDFSALYQNHINSFNYFVNANLSLVQTKSVYIDELPQEYAWLSQTGRTQKELGEKGLTAIGYFQNYDEINDPNVAVYGNRSEVRPGDIRYKDLNNDGVINALDESYIGSTKPDIYYGLTAGFSWKGLDASFLLQGVANRVTRMYGGFEQPFQNNGQGNAFVHNLDRWTEDNPNAKLPRVSLNNTNNYRASTFWLKNSSYLRLKNVEIGYTLPTVLTRHIGIPSVRFFVNGLNLLTFTPLNDWRDDMDPEAYGSTYPTLRTVNFGVSIKL